MKLVCTEVTFVRRRFTNRTATYSGILLEYVRLNPDFDERKIPMTNTKLMMINRDNNIVHEFVKQEYVCQNRDIEKSSLYLYNRFKSWLQDSHDSTKKPPTVQKFTRSLRSLGLKVKCKRVGDRKNNKKEIDFLFRYFVSKCEFFLNKQKRKLISFSDIFLNFEV